MISKQIVARINSVCGHILRFNNKGGWDFEYGLHHCYQDRRSVFKCGSAIGTQSQPQ